MYKLVEGPDGKVLKDLYFIKSPRNNGDGLFLMSDGYQDKIFINLFGPGWKIKGIGPSEIYITETLSQAKKDLGETSYLKLSSGWWYSWYGTLAKGYRFIEAANILIGEL